MSDFIELTDPDSGDKVLANTGFILSVHSCEYAGALLKVAHSGVVQELLCKESYDDLKKLLRRG